MAPNGAPAYQPYELLELCHSGKGDAGGDPYTFAVQSQLLDDPMPSDTSSVALSSSSGHAGLLGSCDSASSGSHGCLGSLLSRGPAACRVERPDFPPPEAPDDQHRQKSMHSTTSASSLCHQPCQPAESCSAAQGAPQYGLNVLATASDLPSGMSRARWCLDDYKVVSLISRRKTSNVYKAVCKHSGMDVALKIYELKYLSHMQTTQLKREVLLQSRLQHRHIIRLYASFQQGTSVVLVQEFADGGDLYSALLQEPGSRMGERRAVDCVIRPLLRALDYMHMLGIAHRDVKLENVLVHRGEVKLADFGIAIDLREERGVTRAGTLNYLSPEVLACPFKRHPAENKNDLRVGGYTTRVDVWSLGVLAYECLNGASPFATESKRQTEDLILRGSLPVFLVPCASENAVSFVYKCLTLDPSSRPNSRQLLGHPFVARTSPVRSAPCPVAAPQHASPGLQPHPCSAAPAVAAAAAQVAAAARAVAAAAGRPCPRTSPPAGLLDAARGLAPRPPLAAAAAASAVTAPSARQQQQREAFLALGSAPRWLGERPPVCSLLSTRSSCQDVLAHMLASTSIDATGDGVLLTSLDSAAGPSEPPRASN